MIFAEPAFMILFALTVLAFFVSPRRWRPAVLIVSGLGFYGVYAPAFLPFVVLLIAATHLARGSAAIWINVAALAGLMGYFKLRAQAAAEAVQSLAIGDAMNRLALPLGASFLIFELIHYAVERRRGRLARAGLAGLAAFALYFPCRIAGPIKRYGPFEQSIREASWSAAQCYRGSVRILWGLLKKLVVADVLALMVAPLNYWTNPAHLWMVLVVYSLYIYADFSAYSDIAIGLSWILGLAVPENFRAPYFSPNIREFWNRWHISLSSWLGDYLFLPISARLARAGTITPRWAAVIGYLATFALCGLWHGPAWHFLLWGVYHGALLSLYSLCRTSGLSIPWPRASAAWRGIGRGLAVAGTFLAVTFGWALFAVNSPTACKLALRLLGLRA